MANSVAWVISLKQQGRLLKDQPGVMVTKMLCPNDVLSSVFPIQILGFSFDALSFMQVFTATEESSVMEVSGGGNGFLNYFTHISYLLEKQVIFQEKKWGRGKQLFDLPLLNVLEPTFPLPVILSS